jgi:hypothetical protein
MKCGKDLRRNLSAILIVAAATPVFTADTFGQVQHLGITQPGGMPGMPVVTGIERLTNGVKVTWDGPAALSVIAKVGSPRRSHGKPLGHRTQCVHHAHEHSGRRLPGFESIASYAGAQACAECHENVHTAERTRHAGRLRTRFVARAARQNACRATRWFRCRLDSSARMSSTIPGWPSSELPWPGGVLRATRTTPPPAPRGNRGHGLRRLS